MKGWRIFVHSVRQVFGNFRAALRVSGLLYLALSLTGLVILGPELSNPETLQRLAVAGQLPWGRIAAAVLLTTVISLWIAVGWHRYVLMVEEPGLLPALHADRIAAYFGKSLLIGLIMILPGFLVGFIGGIAAAAYTGGNVALLADPQAALALNIGTAVLAVPLMIILYRLITALPGVALRPGVPVLTGWQATKGETGTFLVIVLIILAAGTISNLIAGALPDLQAVRLIWGVVVGWTVTMVSISLLTTLYGHYVEKRALV